MSSSVGKKIKTVFICAFLISVLGFIAFFTFRLCDFPSKKRYIFLFPSVGSDSNIIETRIISLRNDQSPIQIYISELLLGPSINRAESLFGNDTKIVFCFVRDKTLFVNLTDGALFPPSEVSLNRSIELFKKNIFKNFKDIKTVTLFIDGNSVEKEA